MSKRTVKVKWQCGHCKSKHVYRWTKWDRFPGETHMECCNCGKLTKCWMRLTKKGNLKQADHGE